MGYKIITLYYNIIFVANINEVLLARFKEFGQFEENLTDLVIRMLFIIIYTFRHIVYFHCTIFLQYFFSKPTCIVIHSAIETFIKWLKCK